MDKQMLAKGPEAIKLGVTDPGAHTTPYLWKYTFLLLIPPLLYHLLSDSYPPASAGSQKSNCHFVYRLIPVI